MAQVPPPVPLTGGAPATPPAGPPPGPFGPAPAAPPGGERPPSPAPSASTPGVSGLTRRGWLALGAAMALVAGAGVGAVYATQRGDGGAQAPVGSMVTSSPAVSAVPSATATPPATPTASPRVLPTIAPTPVPPPTQVPTAAPTATAAPAAGEQCILGTPQSDDTAVVVLTGPGAASVCSDPNNPVRQATQKTPIAEYPWATHLICSYDAFGLRWTVYDAMTEPDTVLGRIPGGGLCPP